MEISMETICDWLEGRLDADEAALVNTRVEHDRELAARVDKMRRLIEHLPLPRSDPPPDLRARLEALFDERGSESGAFDRYSAELVSDSRNNGRSAPGMRGGGSEGDARHLLFSCQILDVSITLRRHPEEHDRTDLKGELLVPAGLDAGMCSVELADESGQTRLAETDPSGEFRIPALSEGEYRLTVHGPGYVVSTPAFDVH